MTESFHDYSARLIETLRKAPWTAIESLAESLEDCWRTGRRLFICGNGGSGANAMHAANDLIYGIGKGVVPGLRAQALVSNSAVITCLANDEGYDQIFARQLAVEAGPGDVLLVFSGSGNSPNILKALEQAAEIGMKSYAVLGYSGGKAKEMADIPIHFAVDDMQISEDLQLVVMHMIMQRLCENGRWGELGEPDEDQGNLRKIAAG
jgi:D-sedoheptulose 7-phosphate isomerase